MRVDFDRMTTPSRSSSSLSATPRRVREFSARVRKINVSRPPTPFVSKLFLSREAATALQLTRCADGYRAIVQVG